MKKFVIGASLAAMLAVPALAAQHGDAGQRPAAAPQTRAQLQASIQQRFAALDANRDGAVTKAEADAARQKMVAERQAHRAERKAERFAMLDTNKDGQISRSEFEAKRADRGERRGGRDHEARGGRHGGHHKGMRGGRVGANWFANMDANKDGRVTLAEASARPLERFNQVDANKDGTVTPEERKAARGMGGRMKGKLG